MRTANHEPRRPAARSGPAVQQAGVTARIALAMAIAIGATAHGATATFQEGLNGYVGTQDAVVSQAFPTSGGGGATVLGWDADDPSNSGMVKMLLIRFDNIFGNGPGQVPVGAQITSATLTYAVYDTGHYGLIHEVLVGWYESVSWNNFGGTPGVQPSEVGAQVAYAPGTGGTQVVNVTPSIAAWSANPTANLGWIVMPTGVDGVDIYTSEYLTNPPLRPNLEITYDAGPPAPTLIRQPYLQSGSPTSMTIVWRTDFATSSRVRYGPTPTQLDQSVVENTPTVDHVVTITSLDPDTTYFYDFGTADTVLGGGDANHYFATSPSTGTATEWTAWILGDSGTGDANQAAVRDAMLAASAASPPELFIHVGDMAYDSGTDLEFTNRFFAPYASVLRHTVCWPSLGNHEGASSFSSTQSGPYFQSYVLPAAGQAGGLPSGTEAYYSFDFANAHFICLDSHHSSRTPGSAMLTWLASDIAATDQRWLIAFWHHPPYSKGTHDSDNVADSGGRMRDMRQYVLPILEAGGVDLVLTGHSHIYERSYLVDGAYDTPTTAAGHIVDPGNGRPAENGAYLKPIDLASHAGAVYVVAGHGGASLGGTGTHPLMCVSEIAFGSCLLTIDGNVASLRNVRSDGAITDTFTLIKTPPGDLDTDGDVDTSDLALFIDVLLGLDLDSDHVARSDIDQSDQPDGLDISAFVNAIVFPI